MLASATPGRLAIAIRTAACTRGKFLAAHFHPRRPHARASHAEFLLHLLDELNEFRNRIHAQQGQEPSIQFEGFLRLSLQRQAGTVPRSRAARHSPVPLPNPRPPRDAFHDAVVHADKDGQPIAHQRANRGHAAHIGGRLFHRDQVGILRGQFLNLFGE